MNKAKKILILFLLLFTQNYPIILGMGEEDSNFIPGSNYKEQSPLDDHGDDLCITSKKLYVEIPTRQKSPSLGKRNEKIPNKFIPSQMIIKIISSLQEPKNQD